MRDVASQPVATEEGSTLEVVCSVRDASFLPSIGEGGEAGAAVLCAGLYYCRRSGAYLCNHDHDHDLAGFPSVSVRVFHFNDWGSLGNAREGGMI